MKLLVSTIKTADYIFFIFFSFVSALINQGGLKIHEGIATLLESNIRYLESSNNTEVFINMCVSYSLVLFERV